MAVFHLNIFSKVIYSYDDNAEFSEAISPVFSVIILVCWFGPQEIFLIIVNIENNYAA